MKIATILTLALLLLAPSARGENERKLPPDFLETGKKLYSQGNEEKLIRHFFDDKESGFFVDIGCAEWNVDSTTLYLEQKLGWKGIAVDARVELRPAWQQRRPGSTFLNFIVTDHAGTKDKFYAVGGISSTNPEHFKSFPLAKDVDLGKIRREVPTITLDKLLDDNAVKKIDFLLLDIELGEPAALRGFTIERFKPELVCVEAGNAEVQKFIGPYFAEHGYERIEAYLAYDTVNWYYKRKAVP